MSALESAPQSSVVPQSARARVIAGRALQKGQQTKQLILDAALALAAHTGLEGLSIGVLAERTGMSKSGVFAHFGSREDLQIAVIHEYHAQFFREIFAPAMDAPRGLERVTALFAYWMQRVALEIQSGCIFISGAVEFDDRPGPVRDALASSVQSWQAAMRRALKQAKEVGQLSAQTDEQQMAFEIHGLILALHYEARFLNTPGAVARANQGFDNILARYQAAPLKKPLRSAKTTPLPQE